MKTESKLVADLQVTLIDMYNQVQEIAKPIKLPWESRRVLGIDYMEVFGDQVSFKTSNDTDFVSLEEAKQALELLVKNFGGTVKWQK